MLLGMYVCVCVCVGRCVWRKRGGVSVLCVGVVICR